MHDTLETVAECTGSNFFNFRLDCKLCTIVDDGIEEIRTGIMVAELFFHSGMMKLSLPEGGAVDTTVFQLPTQEFLCSKY